MIIRNMAKKHLKPPVPTVCHAVSDNQVMISEETCVVLSIQQKTKNTILSLLGFIGEFV